MFLLLIQGSTETPSCQGVGGVFFCGDRTLATLRGVNHGRTTHEAVWIDSGLWAQRFFSSPFHCYNLKLCATVKVVSFTAFRGGFRESPSHAAFKA